MNDHIKKVVDYYNSLESKLGYTFLTWDTKHFGYYPSKKPDITEKQAQREIMDLLANQLQLKSTDIVLDAGCGRGTTSCYLAKKYGYHITGIDIVEFELKMAKRRAEKLNLREKVTFFLQDYSNTQFPDYCFDKIFTLETLVHSPDFHKTLGEFHRLLKVKGRLALFEYTLSPSEEFNAYDRRMLDIINTGSAMMSLDKMLHNNFKKDIEKNGFKVITDETITEYIRPSMERFYQYAKIPYKLIQLFQLQSKFINTTAGVEFYKMGLKGLVHYHTIIAEKY